MANRKKKRTAKAPPAPPKNPLWQLAGEAMPRQTRWLIALGLGLLAFLLYVPTLSYEYAFDDDVYARKNRVTQQGFSAIDDMWGKGTTYGFDGQSVGTYRPITLMTFAMESNQGRFDPTTSHRVNVFLYGLCIALLFLLLAHIFPQQKVLLLGLLTVLFATHPIHVEVVANVKSRDELLAFLFLMGGVLLFVEKKNLVSVMLGSGLFLLACLSKEIALSYLLVIPFLLFFYKKLTVKYIATISIGLILATGTYFLLRMQALDSGVDDQAMTLYNNAIMAAEGTMNQLATKFLVLGKYLGLLFFPLTLTYDYSFAQVEPVSWGHIGAWGSLLVYVGIIALGIWGSMRKEKWALGIVMYLLPLAIVSNFLVLIAATMAERFLFLPSLGWVIAIGAVAIWGIGKLKQQGIVPVLLGVVIVLFAWKSIERMPAWENDRTLFASGVETSPNSFRTHHNLAEVLRTEGEATGNKSALRQAVAHYQKSLSLISDQPNSWYNLGVCFQVIGNDTEAEKAFEEAVRLDPNNASAANNLGVIFFQQNNFPKAIEWFQKAVVMQPTFADAYVNLGASHQNQGLIRKAISFYEAALQHNPQHQNAQTYLMRARQALGEEP